MLLLFLLFKGEELWSDTSESEYQENADMYPKHVWSLAFFLLLWQAIFHVSNAAVKSILCFFKYFTLLVGKVFQSQPIVDTSHHIPLTYEKVCSMLLVNDDFTEFVVCPTCDLVYYYDDCVISTGNGDNQNVVAMFHFLTIHNYQRESNVVLCC